MTLSSEAPVTVDAVIGQALRDLDLSRKITLLTGAAMFSLADEPTIVLHGMVFSDGPTGVRGAEFVGGRRPTGAQDHCDVVTGHAGGVRQRAGGCRRVRGGIRQGGGRGTIGRRGRRGGGHCREPNGEPGTPVSRTT